MNYLRSTSLLAALFLLNITALAQGVSRAECFPFENLSPDKRKAAEELLLKAMDEAALYTLVGGIKPMSSGIKSFNIRTSLPRISVDEANKAIAELGGKNAEELTPAERGRLSEAKQTVERRGLLSDIEDVREILQQWRCGDDIFAAVQHYNATFEGRRFLDVIVFSRPAVRRMIGEKEDFFSRWGITQGSHPLEIVYAVENEKTSARNGGYGYLFGYPDHAVRFFVEASNEENLTGQFVTRDFISIPTYARETNLFVYAVPKGYTSTAVDASLKERSLKVLNEYRKRRENYVGEGKRGILELVRDWFCNSDGQCSQKNAKF
ncbi:MAG: hypothetical protein KF855_12105 [Acidobacteria bacterium]|nr:hypothetical protein [Acidobacteriota bacterium]